MVNGQWSYGVGRSALTGMPRHHDRLILKSLVFRVYKSQ